LFCQIAVVRSTRNQKLLALAIIMLALLLLTPLAEIAVGVAVLAAFTVLMIRYFPRARGSDRR
jgi:hypothetical protein